MTEADWLAGDDPALMLAFVRDRASVRKLRLFACAEARTFTAVDQDQYLRQAVEAAEAFADGSGDAESLRAARYNVADLVLDSRYARQPPLPPRAGAALLMAVADDPAVSRPPHSPERTDLLRCVFGNSFHPVTADLSWLTATVVTLAETIYVGRAFDHLPILADALQDAGCEDDQVLAHCRVSGPHVRGCWAVDLVTGRG